MRQVMVQPNSDAEDANKGCQREDGGVREDSETLHSGLALRGGQRG